MLHPVDVSIPYASKIKIVPSSCIHWPHTDKALLREWVETLKEENTYGMLLGDTFEFARTTVRKFLRTYVGDETSMTEVDDMVEEQVRALAKILEPVKHKILGVVRGNHYYTFQGLGGINSEQLLSQILGLRYLGPAGVIRLDLRRDDKVRDSITFWLHHHGGAKGSTPGGDVNGLLKQNKNLRADVYIIAHTHDCYARVEMERVVSPKGSPPIISEEDRAYIRAGCMRVQKTPAPDAFTVDRTDYADEAAYSPRRGGFVELNIQYQKKTMGNRRVMCRRFKVSH